MQRTILAFGELLWDLLPSGPVLGGAPANFAYRIHSLGERGVLVSRLGRDQLGQAAFSQLAALGMETSYIQWDNAHPTGTVQITLDGHGNPDFHIVPAVAYDHIENETGLLNLAAQADCICFGTLAQRSSTTRRTLELILQAAPQALKLLDINLRKDCYSAETILQSLEHADILKLNQQEAIHLASLFQLSPTPLHHFATAVIERWELACCLVTLGERGAFVAKASGEKVYSPGYQVPLVDTCGSGDACTAGFLHAWLAKEALARSLELGNALGALVATQRGATEPISPQQLDAFLTQPPTRITDPALAPWIVHR